VLMGEAGSTFAKMAAAVDGGGAGGAQLLDCDATTHCWPAEGAAGAGQKY